MADDLVQRLTLLIENRRALGEYDVNAIVILETLQALLTLASRMEVIFESQLALEHKVDTMQALIRASQAVSTWSDSTPAGADATDWRKRKPRAPAGGTNNDQR